MLLASVQDTTHRHEVERLKREFVAMVSHDLRTPLTSVHGSLTLLSAGALGDLSAEAQEVLTTAEGELERLTKLVGDLLDVAKIEAGRMEVNAMSTPMQPIIARSMASINNFAKSQGVCVKAEQCDAQVMADSERLVQVLVNLLSNAVKFSPADSTVSINTNVLDHDLEVRVTDHGRGVPTEHQAAIFERFHQVEGADATEKKGTGLGLPICKEIIEQHGGTIGVRSQPGGTTFWFTIPLVKPGYSNSIGQATLGALDDGKPIISDSKRQTADLT
jgi:signal transduction histidine kinase